MPTLAEVKKQIGNIDGVSSLFGSREIKELPNILWEDEIIERIVQGTYRNGAGVLVATNKRLMFINKGLIYGLQVEDFQYSNISSIEYSTGMILGKIRFYASGNRAEIENVEKKACRDFADYVRARTSPISEKATENSVEKVAPEFASKEESSKPNVADEIREFKKLMDEGIITEEDFNEKKKQLLGL